MSSQPKRLPKLTGLRPWQTEDDFLSLSEAFRSSGEGFFVVSFLDTATAPLGIDREIGKTGVGRDSSFDGETIETARIRQDRGVLLLAIEREQGMRFIPSAEDGIEPGDWLIATGELSPLRQLQAMAASGR